MLSVLFRAVFGTKHQRDVKRMRPAVEAINALAPELERVSDTALAAKTDEFRKRLADGEELDDLLVEAFAVCREAARRTVRMRHCDVQLMGGMVLHRGTIAEMATGEGKTLVATLAAYLNALPGLGTHVVTVNDYLARRDAQWMGPIYHALGLAVGVIQHEVQYLYDPTYASPDIRLAGLRPCTRREAYHADITYGTNNEFGFDYLRDNMRFSLEEMVQREHHYAIVDEVDSILIDEARTPLIISGRDESAENKAPLYEQVDRLMPGRRWSDGLHEAVEAKERIKIARENQTLATITLQNYFRMYDKLAGMTGTAATEAEEFAKIYELDVTVIPTNRTLIRLNHPDVVYKTEREKFDAVANEIVECHGQGQPVLVGTVSIEKPAGH